jgi:hypothetical protein
MEGGTGRCERTKRLAIIQNDEFGRTDPAVQPVSNVAKITVVCALLSTTTKLVVKSGLIVFETVEDGFVKFSWKMEQMCVAMCEVCVLLLDTR